MPPPLRTLFPDDRFPDIARVAPVARAQGRAALLRLDIADAADTDALARRLHDIPPAAPWDGYVLDCADSDITRGPHPLDVLLRAMHTPRP